MLMKDSATSPSAVKWLPCVAIGVEVLGLTMFLLEKLGEDMDSNMMFLSELYVSAAFARR
jgi:hypothetical protein